MSSVLVRDTFEIADLDALAEQDCRVEYVTPALPGIHESWVTLSNMLTDHVFSYKLSQVYSFLRTMKG